MSAVGGGEGVIHVDLCIGSERFRKFLVVFLFADVEAGVLQNHHAAVAESRQGIARSKADAVFSKGHGGPEKVA